MRQLQVLERKRSFSVDVKHQPMYPVPRHHRNPPFHLLCSSRQQQHRAIRFRPGSETPLPICLRVEQRLSLPISRFGVCNAAEQAVATGVRGRRDINRDDSENRENSKRKDPLQSNNLNRNLLDSQSCTTISDIPPESTGRNLHRVRKLRQ
jgi:hypothetical protein